MLQMLKKEFSVQKLSLNLNNGNSMHESWVFPPCHLLLLRLSMSTFCVTIILVSVIKWSNSRWLIYLTNWSFLLLTITMVGLTLVSVSHIFKKNERDLGNDSRRELYEMENAEMTTDTQFPVEPLACECERNLATPSLIWYEKLVWFLWVVSANAGLVVTIEYWLLVFRPPTSFMDISVHALNSLIILIELFMGKLPVRILHWIYVLAYSIVYAVFTVIYWAAGGVNARGDPYIYDILDYEDGKPGKIAAVLFLSIFFLTPLVQLILFGLYQVRFLLDKKKHSNNNNVIISNTVA